MRMSGANPNRFTTANNSSQSACREKLLWLPLMDASHFFSHALDLGRMLEHWVIAMPLHEIRASHKGSMFGGASVIVPKIEICEVNRVFKRQADQAVLAQSVHDRLRSRYLAVCAGHDFLGLRIYLINDPPCMAITAKILHGGLSASVVWTLFRNLVE